MACVVACSCIPCTSPALPSLGVAMTSRPPRDLATAIKRPEHCAVCSPMISLVMLLLALLRPCPRRSRAVVQSKPPPKDRDIVPVSSSIDSLVILLLRSETACRSLSLACVLRGAPFGCQMCSLAAGYRWCSCNSPSVVDPAFLLALLGGLSRLWLLSACASKFLRRRRVISRSRFPLISDC